MSVDPFTLEICRNRLDSIVQEMATALIKTSSSPTTTETKDFSHLFLITKVGNLPFLDIFYTMLHQIGKAFKLLLEIILLKKYMKEMSL